MCCSVVTLSFQMCSSNIESHMWKAAVGLVLSVLQEGESIDASALKCIRVLQGLQNALFLSPAVHLSPGVFLSLSML